MPFDSFTAKRSSAARRFLQRRLLLAYVLAIALFALGVQAGIVVPGTAQAAAMAPCASSSEIAAMLDEGPYAPGEAIVVVDRSQAVQTDPLDNATELMHANAKSFEEATGKAAQDRRGVVIEHVVCEGADTAELLAELANDPHVLSVEPNYVCEVPDANEVKGKTIKVKYEQLRKRGAP